MILSFFLNGKGTQHKGSELPAAESGPVLIMGISSALDNIIWAPDLPCRNRSKMQHEILCGSMHLLNIAFISR